VRSLQGSALPPSMMIAIRLSPHFGSKHRAVWLPAV
jgi:hypothetical protein